MTLALWKAIQSHVTPASRFRACIDSARTRRIASRPRAAATSIVRSNGTGKVGRFAAPDPLRTDMTSRPPGLSRLAMLTKASSCEPLASAPTHQTTRRGRFECCERASSQVSAAGRRPIRCRETRAGSLPLRAALVQVRWRGRGDAARQARRRQHPCRRQSLPPRLARSESDQQRQGACPQTKSPRNGRSTQAPRVRIRSRPRQWSNRRSLRRSMSDPTQSSHRPLSGPRRHR